MTIGIDVGDKTGGWPEKEHDIFVKVFVASCISHPRTHYVTYLQTDL
jgi:hypothetical protein